LVYGAEHFGYTLHVLCHRAAVASCGGSGLECSRVAICGVRDSFNQHISVDTGVDPNLGTVGLKQGDHVVAEVVGKYRP
jgi:hypothetical protein